MEFKTQEEKDETIYRYRNFIADKVVDLQKFPMSLKDVEDQEGTLKVVKKIEDACTDIRKGYIRLEDAEYAEVEEDTGSMYIDDENEGFY